MIIVGFTWTINKRAKTRWGLCKQNPDKTFEIQIAERLLTDDRISEKACKKRVTTGTEKGVEDYKSTNSMAIKYIFTCGQCGATIYRKRDSRFTKYYRHYGCARCGAVAWKKEFA